MQIIATPFPAASPAAPARKRKRGVLERIPTPPPRTRAKTQRFASEEAQKAGAAAVRARKKATVASKKTVKNIHSQHMRQLKDTEVYTVSILLSFHLALC
jgi:CubicO group peptidase (beta-lactamase class C family)